MGMCPFLTVHRHAGGSGAVQRLGVLPGQGPESTEGLQGSVQGGAKASGYFRVIRKVA